MKKYSLEIVHSLIFISILIMLLVTKSEYDPNALQWVSSNALLLGLMIMGSTIVYLFAKGNK